MGARARGTTGAKVLSVALLFGLPASACSNPVEPPATHFVGNLEGEDVKVGLVVSDGHAAAYLCGQGPTLDTHTRWFIGSVEESRMALSAGDWTLAGRWDAGELSGELRGPGGKSVPFHGRALPDDQAFGIFETRVGSCRAGAIVWPAEEGGDATCRVRGAVCESGDGGPNAQVTPVDCPRDGELFAIATRMGTAVTLDLLRVQAPLALPSSP